MMMQILGAQITVLYCITPHEILTGGGSGGVLGPRRGTAHLHPQYGAFVRVLLLQTVDQECRVSQASWGSAGAR